MKIEQGLKPLVCLAVLVCVSSRGQPLDTTRIEQIIGLKGAMNTNQNVFKITVPRNDVKISVDGWTMPPFMGLARGRRSRQDGRQAMVMGDTVLFQDEVNPVMSAALDNGLSVTALHNHFFYDEPKVYFMHIGGEGLGDKSRHGGQESLGQNQGNPRRESGSRPRRLAARRCRQKFHHRQSRLKSFLA